MSDNSEKKEGQVAPRTPALEVPRLRRDEQPCSLPTHPPLPVQAGHVLEVAWIRLLCCGMEGGSPVVPQKLPSV